MERQKTGSVSRCLSAALGGMALTLASWTASANGIVAPTPRDTRGYVTATDSACARDAACALGRGGISDMLSIYNPDHSVLARVYAFGNEEANNLYYLHDPGGIWFDVTKFGQRTTLLEENGGSWSDTFGIAANGMLAFVSDPNSDHSPSLPGLTFREALGYNNPFPEGDPDSVFFTIAYDATWYLSSQMQALGYTADFRSDVPEPGSMLLLGAGMLGLGALRRRQRAARAG
ncbi:MAG: hypothetical protein RJA36_1218 [Pseudomonadota bacterium]